MNPIYAWIVSSAAVLRHKKRKCARCGHRQTVSEADRANTVMCERCGKPLPPEKA